jgi:hypothetical protein
MQVNGLIQVRQDTPLLEPGMEVNGKVVERIRLIGMTRGMECGKCSFIQVNQARQGIPLL